MSYAVWFRLGFILPLLALCGTARAQAVQVETQVSATTVEAGGTIQLQASAMSTGDAPSQPRLETPPGVSVRGPSVGTNQRMSFGTGGMHTERGITATWQLTLTQVGQVTVGPASVLTPKGRVAGETVTIRVVPKGSLPEPPRRQRRRSLFDDDFFKSPLGRRGSIFDDLLGELEPRVPEAPREYRASKAPDPNAFLRAVAQPRTVVVGQQVTLNVYAYHAQGRFSQGISHEARHPDFFAYELPTERRPQWYQTDVEGRTYTTVKLSSKALFPLKAGDLDISAMDAELRPPGLHPTADGVIARSLPIQIHVVEPPLKGRPPGYVLGDVGDYELSVTVTPREVEAGGSISVIAHLEGTGNVPTGLITPDQRGVEWLEPNVKEELKKLADDRVGGSRTFTYVVRLLEPGEVDLGELKLPYYSVTQRRYRTAARALGKVTVKGTAAPATAATTDTHAPAKLSLLLRPRDVSATGALVAAPITDQRWFWLLLFGGPLSMLTLQLATTQLRGLIRRKQQRSQSEHHRAKQALLAASRALSDNDNVGATAAVERATFLAVEGATGLKARAILRSELEQRLTEAGLSGALSLRVAELLSACEGARFGGDGQGLSNLMNEAKALVAELRRVRPKSGATVSGAT